VFSYHPGDKEPQILHTFRNGDLSGIEKTLCPPKRPCQHTPQQRLNAMASYPMSSPVQASNGVFYGDDGYSRSPRPERPAESSRAGPYDDPHIIYLPTASRAAHVNARREARK